MRPGISRLWTALLFMMASYGASTATGVKHEPSAQWSHLRPADNSKLAVPVTVHRQDKAAGDCQANSTRAVPHLQLICDVCNLLIDVAVLHQLILVTSLDAIRPWGVVVHGQLGLTSSQGGRLARLGTLSMKLSK